MNLEEELAIELTKIPKGYIGITDPDPELYKRKLKFARAQAKALIPIIMKWHKQDGHK